MSNVIVFPRAPTVASKPAVTKVTVLRHCEGPNGYETIILPHALCEQYAKSGEQRDVSLYQARPRRKHIVRWVYVGEAYGLMLRRGMDKLPDGRPALAFSVMALRRNKHDLTLDRRFSFTDWDSYNTIRTFDVGEERARRLFENMDAEYRVVDSDFFVLADSICAPPSKRILTGAVR